MKKILSNETLSSFCMEMSLLLHAGISTGDALFLLAEERKNWKLLFDLAEQADSGESLSAVLRASGAFPPYLCGLIEVGERTGRTEEAMEAVLRYYDSRVRLERQLHSAVLYPLMMMFLMLIIIGVLLMKVLPIFNDVYASLGGRLTGVAGGLLRMGQWLENAMPIVWLILAAVALFGLLFAVSASARAGVVSVWKKCFGDRGVSRKISNARLAQALSMGVASGLPLEEAIALSAGLLEGAAKKRCAECQSRLSEGEGLSAALRFSGLLPASQRRLLELGQRSGAGDVSLKKIAQDLTEESEAAIEALVSRVEPTLVIACSVLIGLILLSVMLPLSNIMAAIG